MRLLAAVAVLSLAVAPAPAADAPSLAASGCPLFPSDSIWHAPVSRPVEGGPDAAGWRAGSGAVFDLRSNRLRPAGWTSADAAGLPILAGLVRYEEVAGSRVDHAIRVTVDRGQAAYLWPARHQAGQAGASLPPMGLRLRAGVDIGGFPSQARVILQAMRTYGLVVADPSPAPDPASARPAAGRHLR
jgi:hypothetical protein